MTVALYIRVSTDEQAEQGYSLEAQQNRLISYCESQGWHDYKLYIDDGYSGTNLNRPGIKRLIRHIEAKKINAVVVYKLDRLSRKQRDVLALLEDVFEKNNVIFRSATEPIDTSSGLGKAMIGVLAVFAQLERDMIVERTTVGRRQRVDRGLWYGGPVPLGYEWDKTEQMLRVVPEEAYIVKQAYKMYLQGHTYQSIADWASARSSARNYYHNTIRDMLKRPIYMGKLINDGVLVDGKHEAIIDEETWHSVQREMSRRRDGIAPVGEYLLTGLLKCGICGGPIVHVKRRTTKNGKTYLYELYACQQQHVRYRERKRSCSLGYQRRSNVEKFVIDQIKAIALDPKKLQKMREKNEIDNNDTNLVEILQQKLKKVNEGLENLYDAIQNGDIKASAVSHRIRSLEEEREKIENQLDELTTISMKQTDPDEVIQIFKQIGDAWDLLTFYEQRMIIRKVVKEIILRKDDDPLIKWN